MRKPKDSTPHEPMHPKTGDVMLAADFDVFTVLPPGSDKGCQVTVLSRYTVSANFAKEKSFGAAAMPKSMVSNCRTKWVSKHLGIPMGKLANGVFGLKRPDGMATAVAFRDSSELTGVKSNNWEKTVVLDSHPRERTHYNRLPTPRQLARLHPPG